MKIKQFEDKNLSHYSYAIVSECESEVILIDPTRDPSLYYQFANEFNAKITGVIETHPHADFVGGHLEIHRLTGAEIFAGVGFKAAFPVTLLEDGQVLEIGKIKLTSLHTPGHSPESICIVLQQNGKDYAVFTGDTLFVGDCGRPDLRGDGGNEDEARQKLASQMYHSLRNQLMKLDDSVLVYPAHGAGTLCGKALSKESSSTIGKEKKENWSLQEMSEESFIKELTEELPFIPAYFPYNVSLNQQGAPNVEESIAHVLDFEELIDPKSLDKALWIIDAREQGAFKNGHLPHSINLMDETKFETWLGSLIQPGEHFYLTTDNEVSLKMLINRTAAIGYEPFIKKAFVFQGAIVKEELIDINKLKSNPESFTVIDVRNPDEVADKKLFENSLNIPLYELPERWQEIPLHKPIAVHCAGGFRSAAASSLISANLKGKAHVYDIGKAIEKFV